MNTFVVRVKAFSFHFAASLVVAAFVGALVFGSWYPYPFWEISGGGGLFTLIMLVDVILGPLITFVAYNPTKSRGEKILDFGVVGLLQISGLLYGLWSLDQARPLYMVFEYRRFAVVHKVDLPVEYLKKFSQDKRLSNFLATPTLLSLRPMLPGEEMQMTLDAINGVPLASRPELWQPYEVASSNILDESRPLAVLINKFSHDRRAKEIILQSVREAGIPGENIGYLPLLSRGKAWTVLVDMKTAQPVGFLPFDVF